MPRADWQKLPIAQTPRVLRMCTLLRLACLLHRRRSEEAISNITAVVENGTLKLRFAPGWLDAHALTRADLEQEVVYLKPANIKLKFK